MPKFLLSFILATLISCSFGQNLVPNPEFDSYILCPTVRGQIELAFPWFSANGKTVDFAHLCAGTSLAGVPLNRWGDQNPLIGGGYAGIRTYFESQDGSFANYREYLSVELTNELDSGRLYFVSFQLSVGESGAFISDDIGLALTDSVGDDDVLPYEPAVENQQGNILDNYAGWRAIRGTYRAKGGEAYATIGNFKPDDQTTVQPGGTWDTLFSSTYYFIDEVIVTPCAFGTDELAIIAPRDTFCQGESLNLSLNPDLELSRFEWFDGSESPSTSVSDSMWVWVDLRDSKGCQRRDSLYLHIEVPPALALGPDTTLCPGDGWLLALPREDGYQYLWENGDTNSFRYLDQAGDYQLRMFNQYCERTDQISLSNPPALPDNFAFDTLACEGAGLLIGFDFPEASYLWEDGSTEAFKSVPRSGNYRLLLQTACYQAEDTYEVTLEDCDCSERIPNMFSPNGDGINDSWWIEFAPGVEEVQWGIVDRWGRPVFEARGPDVRWEGRFAQRQAPEGVYFWWVRYRCWNGTEFAFTQSKGSLTLIR